LSLKVYTKQNVQLYKIWFFVKQNLFKQMLKVRLPYKNDDFYLDGYPRSGNTFCVSFIKRFYPTKNFSHHLHSIAGFKIALKFNLKCFALFRDPLDAVASLAIMQNFYGKWNKESNSLLSDNLNEYISYYQYLILNKNKIEFIEFDAIINSITLKEFFEKNIESNNITSEDLNNFEIDFKSHQKTKPSLRSSSPNKTRNLEKENVKKLIRALPNYPQALKVFNEMKEIVESEHK